MFLTSVVGFILIFTAVVVIHEAGHFIAALLTGIHVHEFAVGLGPTLFARKWGSAKLALNAFPLGGYIKIAGLDPEDKETSPTPIPYENTYPAKPALIRALSIVAGPMMNFILAFFIAWLIIGFVGEPTPSSVIERIEEKSPAQAVGLLPGDKLTQLNGQPIVSMEEAIRTIHQSDGIPISLTAERSKKQIQVTVTPHYDPKIGKARIGFSPASILLHPPFYLIPFHALTRTIEQAFAIITSLFSLVTGKISVLGLVGPVGIAYLSGHALQSGFFTFLSFTAMLSLNLFVLNLLPIPALDGGRLFFIVLEMIARKPVLNFEREAKVHYVGMIILLALIAILTIKDFIRLPI